MRPVTLIWYWTFDASIFNIDYVQQVTKLCVGVVQDWITFELAVRIHNSIGLSEISEATIRKLRMARRYLFAVSTLAFIAFSIAVIVTAHMDGNHGRAFYSSTCLLIDIVGYCFLC